MKKILTNNIGLKLLSLLFAIVLWLVVVNIDDPKVTRTIQGIPVTILDEEVITDNNQIYTVVSGKEVSITVSGPRSLVDKMTKDYFIAEAPFSEKSNVDAVPIYVSFRNSKYDKDCEITQKTMSMRLNIEPIVNKDFEIDISHSGELSSSYYLGKETITPLTVNVSAPETLINQIEYVQVEPDLSSRTSDFTTQLSIKYYTEMGKLLNLGSDVSVNTDTVTYTATIYQVREVPIKYGYTGRVADGYELVEITSGKNTVKIAGPDAALIENIVIPDELINVSGAQANVTVEADISALLPSGVYLCNETDSIIQVTAKIEKLITNTYHIPVSGIDKNNIPPGYTAEISEQNISISLTGLGAAHNEFSVNNVNAYVDLRNTVEGNNEVIVRLTIPNNLKLVNEVKVNVVLTKESTGTEVGTGSDVPTESVTAPTVGDNTGVQPENGM